jgi:alkylated DNA repair dioxygenase AlkB
MNRLVNQRAIPTRRRMTDPRAAGKERLQLDATTWVDVWRDWLDDGGATYQEFVDGLAWRETKLWRYDHYVTEPRLSASLRRDGFATHPVLRRATLMLRETYKVELDGPAIAYYRDGRDALGAHRDRELRYTSNTLVAILTLGARRPWELTPIRSPQRAVRGRLRPEPTVDLQPGNGDLFVLGGRGQADWLHGVPPVPGLRSGRISLQWRWTSRTGPPERGPGYRAPRHYSP